MAADFYNFTQKRHLIFWLVSGAGSKLENELPVTEICHFNLKLQWLDHWVENCAWSNFSIEMYTSMLLDWLSTLYVVKQTGSDHTDIMLLDWLSTLYVVKHTGLDHTDFHC